MSDFTDVLGRIGTERLTELRREHGGAPWIECLNEAIGFIQNQVGNCMPESFETTLNTIRAGASRIPLRLDEIDTLIAEARSMAEQAKEEVAQQRASSKVLELDAFRDRRRLGGPQPRA